MSDSPGAPVGIPGFRAPLAAEERLEVQAAWDNIMRRRTERRAGRTSLVRTGWIFTIGLVGPWMGAWLAARNLRELGKPGPAARVLVLGVLTYAAVVLGLLFGSTRLPAPAVWWIVFGYSFFGALLPALLQSRDTRLGFEDGGTVRSPLVPGLLALVVLIAEGFAARALVGPVLL